MVKLNINWQEVYDKYKDGKQIQKLADEYGVFYQTINRNFKILGFKKRSKSEAQKLIIKATGKDSANWKGGEIKRHGHIYIRSNSKYVPKHVYVWELHYSKVPWGYVVHHKDFNKENNDISNLELMTDFAHKSLHSKRRKEENDKKFKEFYEKRQKWKT